MDYAQPFSYYEPPHDLVDHTRERLHQHNSFLGVLSRKKPDQKIYPNHPDVDLSDALTHYLIELEVPGVKDVKAIDLTWRGRRCLVISGSTFRSWKQESTATPERISKNGVLSPPPHPMAAVDTNGSKAQDITGEGRADMPPYLVVGERRIGSFRREFHFPDDVEMEKIDAQLEAGLLRVVMPKKVHSDAMGSGQVKVRGMD